MGFTVLEHSSILCLLRALTQWGLESYQAQFVASFSFVSGDFVIAAWTPQFWHRLSVQLLRTTCAWLMGHTQMSNIVAPPPAMQLPGSVWVTLPVPSCLDTSAPSLRPFSGKKLSFPPLLKAQPLAIPSCPLLPAAQSGISWPKAQGRHCVTETSQRAAWILILFLQNAPGSHCKKKVLLCSSAWSPCGTCRPNQVSSELGLPGACH